MTDLGASTGRREAHKQATRVAILDAAVGLIAQKGFEDTTVREIADAAGVTERTFYRYFPGKDGIVAEQAREWLAALHLAIVHRPPDETPFRAVQRGLVEALSSSGDDQGPPLARLLNAPRPVRILPRGSPRPLLRVEETISDAARQRAAQAGGAPLSVAGDLQVELLGRLAVAALRSAVSRHRLLTAAPTGSPGLPSLLDAAFAAMAALVEGAPIL